MKFIHMSDLHLTENGMPIWDVYPLSNFNKAIEMIAKMSDISCIIVSGDISDDGSMWSYRYADDAFRELGIPTYWCFGNHDDINLHKSFINRLFSKLDRKFVIDDCKFLLLNTVLPDIEIGKNKARGALSEVDMQWLNYELFEDAMDSIIVFHHPVIETGGWLDRKMLDNREKFKEIIAKHSNVRLVLYGHIHCSLIHQVGTICFSSASSTGFSFDNQHAEFEIIPNNESFDIINIKTSTLSKEIIYINRV